MSSGLVATMGLPAQAAQSADVAAPATAPIAVQPAIALQSGLMSAVGSAQTASTELTAPAGADVTFEDSAFKAVPQPTSSGGSVTALRADLSGDGFGSARGSSVLAVAARYLGVPYVYGGTTPAGWDCSGATRYIFAQLGIDLPRTATEQMRGSKRISRDEAQPGDLVFISNDGVTAGHVGIYAGGNMFYDAGSSGGQFSYREIFSSAVVFGRV